MRRVNALCLFVSIICTFTGCSGWQKTVQTIAPVNTAVVKPTRDVCISNSTVAKYLGAASVPSLLFTQEEIERGYSCHSLVVPGHTICQQLALWKAYAGKIEADWIIEIGLNDLRPADPIFCTLSLPTAYRYDINMTKKPAAKVIIATMTPDRQRIIEVSLKLSALCKKVSPAYHFIKLNS